MIRAAIVKDVRLLLRDRGRLLMLLVMPLAFIIAFGSMFKLGVDRGTPRAIAVWHAPGDARGEAIVRALGEAPGFAPRAVPSADEVRRQVASERVIAGLVIPPDFDPSAGKPVELALDLGAPIQLRGPIEGALTAIVMRALAPVPVTAMPRFVEARTPPGIRKPLDGITGFQVAVPGNGVLFGFFIAMTVAITFAGERHSGTWRRMLAAPVARWKLLAGMVVPYYLIGVLQLAILFGVGAGVFGMQVAGSLVALVVLSLLVVACATALGLLVASFGWTEKQIGSIVPVGLLVMGLVGGCMFPRLAMPDFMRDLGHVVPHSWALDGYYTILVREGATLADIVPSIAALGAFAAGFAVLGLWRFKFE